MGYADAPSGWWKSFVLEAPPRMAKLGIVRADGSPHVAPVWVDLSFVTISGTAQTSEDPVELLNWATRIGGRYMGADRAEEFGRRNGVAPEMVVRVSPSRIVA
jgi:hypothetical protein